MLGLPRGLVSWTHLGSQRSLFLMMSPNCRKKPSSLQSHFALLKSNEGHCQSQNSPGCPSKTSLSVVGCLYKPSPTLTPLYWPALNSLESLVFGGSCKPRTSTTHMTRHKLTQHWFSQHTYFSLAAVSLSGAVGSICVCVSVYVCTPVQGEPGENIDLCDHSRCGG